MKVARDRGVAEMSYRYEQDFSELVDKYCAYGPPQQVIDSLSEFIEAGANYLILAPIMPPEAREEHLEQLAKEVVPHLEKVSVGRVI